MNRCRAWWTAATVIASLALPSIASAELSPGDKAKLEAAKMALDQAVPLYKAKKFAELGTLLEDAEAKLNELKKGEAKDEVAALEPKLAAAHRLLKNALDDIPKPTTPTPAKTTPTKTPPGKTPAPVAGQVSFSKDIAPLFVRSCNNCHVTGVRGGLSLRTYPDILKGSQTGLIFTPGKAEGGVLMEQLVTGGMPQGGRKFTDAEINTVAMWIAQGAKFDGPDPSVSIATLVTGGAGGNNMPTIARPTGNEKVAFMRDIAPVLVESCVRCHSGQQPAGQYSMVSFDRFIRGSNNGGPPIVPGDAARSLLIMKLRGTAKEGRRMPAGRDALPEDTIKKFETWIAEGGKFDGEDAAQSLDFALKVIKARKMTHDELAAWRTDLSTTNWLMSNPNVKPDVVSSSDITLMGRLPTVQMQDALKVADGVRSKVAAAFKMPVDKPLLKGKLTLFVFEKRFEYSEYSRMVERRDPPSDVAAHWRYDVVEAYGCVPAPRDGDTAFPGNVAEQLAGVYVESLGRGIPRWFSVGSARMIAAKVEPKSVVVKQWEDAIAPAMASAGKIDQILAARDLDGSGSALSYHLVKFMAAKQNVARYNQLLDLLKRGTPFNNALQQTYGMDAKKLAAACFR